MVYICMAVLVLAVSGLVYQRIMWPPILKTGNGPHIIAFVGDSITYGLGVVGRRKTASFPALVAESLGADYSAENYGLSDRTLQSEADKPYFREKVGKQAWNAKADILIFMLGSNDCKRKNWNADRFRQEYSDVLRHYLAAGFRQIFVMIPPRIFYAKAGKTGYDNRILEKEMAPIIQQEAGKLGIPCIDLYALTKDHQEWFPDKLHPNAAGNRAIAELILKSIQEQPHRL